jgi:hypothetical protein
MVPHLRKSSDSTNVAPLIKQSIPYCQITKAGPAIRCGDDLIEA